MRRVAILLVAVTALTACGGQSSDGTSGAGDGTTFSEADVDFAGKTIQRDAETLVMIDLTLDRKVSDDIASLAESIREARTAEIERLTRLLSSWDREVPETIRDHVNAGADAGSDPVLPDDEAALVAAAPPEAFDGLWLRWMVAHYEPSLTLATHEVDGGTHPGAVAAAKRAVRALSGELDSLTSARG